MAYAIDRSDSVGDNSFPFNESFLIITDVDVKVGSKSDKNLKHGDDISDEAAPGDRVEFDVEVANIFTRDDDIEIEDISITITIEDIDDGDELEEESREFDLRADRDDKETITFEIPLEVEDGTFDVLIEVEGDSDNGSQEARMELSLEVEKERDEVRFLTNSLLPSEIQCSRTVQLSTGVINTGRDEQDDASMEVSNAQLGISFRDTFDLSDDPFDEDSKFRKTYTFTVPDDVPAGVYPITSRVTFEDGRSVETETADLVVRACDVEAVQEEKEKPKEEEEQQEDVVVVQPPAQTPVEGQPTTAQPVVTPPTLPPAEPKSLFESTGFLAALIAGEILLVIIAILIVVAIFRKRG